MRVLIADKLAESVTDALEQSGHDFSVEPNLKDESLVSKLRELNPNVLVVRSTKVREEHIEAAPGLSAIIRAGAGTNTIDVVAASNRGIYVTNCPGKNAIAVAELTMGHLINCDRRISDNVASLRSHQWAKKAFSKARGLHGRNLAVLGCGQIGREVISRALSFGMSVRAWSRSLTPEMARELGVTHAATPLEACQGADALTVHLALNDATRSLVGRELLEALAPGAYIINTSRGELIDQPVLEELITARNLRAGLDVFAEEPGANDTTFDYPIADNPAVYGTHHIGASTTQASEAVGAEVVRIIDVLQSEGRAPNCVNIADQTPATHTLVVRHADRVGVLASVLTHVREEGINVAEMENIIFRGSAACARIQLTGSPTDSLLEKLNTSPDIFAASIVAMEARS